LDASPRVNVFSQKTYLQILRGMLVQRIQFVHAVAAQTKYVANKELAPIIARNPN